VRTPDNNTTLWKQHTTYQYKHTADSPKHEEYVHKIFLLVEATHHFLSMQMFFVLLSGAARCTTSTIMTMGYK
jgi:hypothetical protein